MRVPNPSPGISRRIYTLLWNLFCRTGRPCKQTDFGLCLGTCMRWLVVLLLPGDRVSEICLDGIAMHLICSWVNPHVEEPEGASLEDIVCEVVWQRGVVPYSSNTFHGPIKTNMFYRFWGQWFMGLDIFRRCLECIAKKKIDFSWLSLLQAGAALPPIEACGSSCTPISKTISKHCVCQEEPQQADLVVHLDDEPILVEAGTNSVLLTLVFWYE